MIAGHHIAGEPIFEGAVEQSVDPADQTEVGTYHLGSRTLVDHAAQVARRAFIELNWSANPRLRAQALSEIADRLEAAKRVDCGFGRAREWQAAQRSHGRNHGRDF